MGWPECSCACTPSVAEADLIPASATFLASLFLRLELGIVIGIGINVLFLLYASARPTMCVQKVMVSHSRLILAYACLRCS